MRVRQFRVLTLDDAPLPGPPDPPREWFRHWSRPYEYAAIIKRLAALGKAATLHNAASGPAENGFGKDVYVPLYRAFWHALEPHAHLILHSDIYDPGQAYPRHHEYLRHDIRDPWLYEPVDACLCVSALEEVEPCYQVDALQHLLASTVVGGTLLVTFDVPGVDVPAVEAWTGRKLRVVTDALRATPSGEGVAPEVVGTVVALLEVQNL